jgi:hypothetical protein
MSSITTYSWEKKMDVVSLYMLLGNLRVVSEKMDVPYNTLTEWKRSDWWPEIVSQVQRQRKNKTTESLTQLVESGIDILKDRLEHGDYVLNNKTGEVIRKPVSAKDATAIVNHLLGRQIQIEELANKFDHKQESVSDTLATIAAEFKKLNKKITTEVIDVPFTEIPNALHDHRESFPTN